MNGENRQKTILRVSWATILVNLLLTACKLLAGLLAHSAAMVSDAVHSASDVLSTLIVLAGARLAGREADGDHPYGHERLECVAAILLAGILCATGIGIGYNGIWSLLNRSPDEVLIPGKLALAAAILSIVVKEGMYRVTLAAGKRISSGALVADAWHHRSDALSSVGSLVGIAGARLGFPFLDPLASVVICGFIVKAAFDIFKDAADKMTDRSCGQEMEDALRETALQVHRVLEVDLLKTRLFGERVYVDLEIAADPDSTLVESHNTAQEVHDAIEAAFPQVKHCMVHVNPARLIQPGEPVS